mmetsp:Transcript_16730/g.32578  ORF Transcript_16730/g.32578 Transcript_16730/m.32578 type:complete len:223 (-) Transcript_16730:733-1401(-)
MHSTYRKGSELLLFAPKKKAASGLAMCVWGGPSRGEEMTCRETTPQGVHSVWPTSHSSRHIFSNLFRRLFTRKRANVLLPLFRAPHTSTLGQPDAQEVTAPAASCICCVTKRAARWTVVFGGVWRMGKKAGSGTVVGTYCGCSNAGWSRSRANKADGWGGDRRHVLKADSRMTVSKEATASICNKEWGVQEAEYKHTLPWCGRRTLPKTFAYPCSTSKLTEP